MKDGNFRVRGLIGLLLVVAIAAVACGGKDASEKQPAPANLPADSATKPGVAAANGCPRDGQWHECSAFERLDRAGLAPRRDSTPATEKVLSRPGVLIHLGDAELELFFYPDEAARVVDEKKLDPKAFITANVPLGIQRERTLIRSVNLLGLLKTLREHQRERVSDALTAGPPQPPT